MIYIGIFIFFITVFIFLYGILVMLFKDKIEVEKRVEKLNDLNNENDDKLSNKSFAERMIKPFYKGFSEALVKMTSGQKREMLNKKLERAGLLKNNNIGRWLFNKSMIIMIFSILMGLIAFSISDSFLKALILASIVMLTINVFFNFYLSKRFESRKRKMLKDLPFTLDLITVSVEAGLSFDGALARVISNISGELSDEFAKSLKEIRMGIERKTALANMAERCDLKALSSLITSITQADELGVSLSRVLRIEAANLREERRQSCREKAMKAPVKMLFPLVFFILPAVFIIILGPAVINMIKVFRG